MVAPYTSTGNVKELEEKQQWLLEESRKAHRDTERVRILMATTYPLQRSIINERATVSAIRAKRPILFEDYYMFGHYFKLTGRGNGNEYIVCMMDSSWCLIQK